MAALTRVCSDIDMSQNGKVNVVQSWELLEVKFPSDASGLFTCIRAELPGCSQVFKIFAGWGGLLA